MIYELRYKCQKNNAVFNIQRFGGNSFKEGPWGSVRSIQRSDGKHPVEDRAHGAPRAFLEGILTEALNVKTALFFWHLYRSS